MAEGHRRCSGEDCISELPDELLHVILLRLGSSRAAARTSALSRRWRRVWTHLPELRLGTHHDPPPLLTSLLDAVDGALAGYSATAPLEHLDILVFSGGPNVTASRAAPWLRFAAKHVVGEFNLRVPYQKMGSLVPPVLEIDGKDQEELELPMCTRAKTIKLKLQDPWRLRPQPAGMFTALISLTIRDCRMEAKELTAMVSKHCPSLRDLILFIELVEVSDVYVLSDTLHSLTFFVANTWQLEVIAPNLEKLTVYDATKARISSPKLAEVVWNGDAYDPRHHKFYNVGRHLRRLEVGQNSAVASFMPQFDEVDDLKLEIFVPWEIARYEKFFNETYKLPRCKMLRISLLGCPCHALAPYMLHILRSCNTRKVYVQLHDCSNSSWIQAAFCPSSCPCRLAESQRIDGIALNSLEELEIDFFKGSKEELKFLDQLSRCTAAVLKKLIINYNVSVDNDQIAKEVCEKVRSMWRPNVKVEFCV